MSAQISFTVPDKALKKRAYQKAKSEGITMKALFIAFLKQYTEGKYEMKLAPNRDWDSDFLSKDEIQASKLATADLHNNTNIITLDQLKSTL